MFILLSENWQSFEKSLASARELKQLIQIVQQANSQDICTATEDMINPNYKPEPDAELAPLLNLSTKDITVTDTLPANVLPEFNVRELLV